MFNTVLCLACAGPSSPFEFRTIVRDLATSCRVVEPIAVVIKENNDVHHTVQPPSQTTPISQVICSATIRTMGAGPSSLVEKEEQIVLPTLQLDLALQSADKVPCKEKSVPEVVSNRNPDSGKEPFCN